jgi:hypothetical protein
MLIRQLRISSWRRHLNLDLVVKSERPTTSRSSPMNVQLYQLHSISNLSADSEQRRSRLGAQLRRWDGSTVVTHLMLSVLEGF